jgi:hypothetical protein
VEQWINIRRLYFAEKRPKRAISRQLPEPVVELAYEAGKSNSMTMSGRCHRGSREACRRSDVRRSSRRMFDPRGRLGEAWVGHLGVGFLERR